MSPHRYPLDPEGLAGHPDIAGAIGHGTSRLGRRAAVTRPVVTDQPQLAAFGVSQRVRTVQAAASRRADVHQHRAAAAIPGILDRQRPAVQAIGPQVRAGHPCPLVTGTVRLNPVV
jgi:hypothetical protein